MSDDDFNALLAFAAAHGLAIFPIKAGCKAPTGIVASHAKDWSRDPEKWRRWRVENPGCNFGVECGPSGLIVIEIDVVEGVPQWGAFVDYWGANIGGEPPQPTVRTPSGGTPRLFPRVTRHRLKLNSAGHREGHRNKSLGNGYVVAPLSRTERASDPQVKADGQYELLRGDIDTAPTPLVAHCTRVNKTSPIVARTLSLAVDGYPLDRVERQFVQARVNSAFDMLRRATVGCRNKTLFRASVMIGAFVADGAIDPQLADALLTEAATEIGLDASEIAKTIHSGFKRGAQDSTALGGNPAIAFEHVHLLPPPQQTENAGGSASPAGSQFADDGIRLRWRGDDDDAPLKEWLVERMLPKSGRALIAGQWGSYKTFVAFDLAGSVITKTPFAGRNVNRQGGVLWLAAEGQDEVRLQSRPS